MNICKMEGWRILRPSEWRENSVLVNHAVWGPSERCCLGSQGGPRPLTCSVIRAGSRPSLVLTHTPVRIICPALLWSKPSLPR